MLDFQSITPTLTLLSILLLHKGSKAVLEEPVIHGKVVPGLYWEDSQVQITTYEKVVPVVFEFKLRSDLWNSLPLGFAKFKVLPRLFCRTDVKASTMSTADWFFTCPLFYYINDFIKQYKVNYTDIHPTSRTLNRPDFQRFSHSSVHFDDCEQIISRSWKGINNRDIGLSEYKILIEKQCNTLPSYFEEQIQDYNNDISSLFDSMKDNFATYFFINSSNPDPGEMINNLMSVQNLLLTNTFSELSRFREAVLSCQSQLIPQSFIKAARLDKALQEVKAKLSPLKYTFSTPSLAKLYKMPIADCIFGTTTLTVQILLPIIKSEANYNLLKFSYPNFLYKDQLCRVKSDEHVNSETENFLYDRNSKALMKTDCAPNDRDLCYIPDISQRPLVNKCIYELLNSSSEGIKRECHFHCQKLSPSYRKLLLPMIKRVSSSKFIITLSRISTMLIKCEGKPDELIAPQEYGAVEIILPCNCYIMYHAEKFYSRSPCGYRLVMSHVIPEHMVNSSVSRDIKLLQGANNYVTASPNDIVNSSLIEDEIIQLIDLSSKESNQEMAGREDENKSNSNDGVNGVAYFTNDLRSSSFPNNATNMTYHDSCMQNYSYLWVFVVLQSVVFVFIIGLMYYKLSLVDRKCDYGRGVVSFSSVSQITNLDDNK